jgi:hypothetical protein
MAAPPSRRVRSELSVVEEALPRYTGPERRAAVESGPFAGLPQWAKVISIVGIPGGIALFLVWVGAQSLPEIKTELVAYRMEAERARQAIQQQTQQSEQIYRMLQRICAEVAKTDEGRARCFDR